MYKGHCIVSYASPDIIGWRMDPQPGNLVAGGDYLVGCPGGEVNQPNMGIYDIFSQKQEFMMP